MTRLAIVLFSLISLISGKPTFLSVPLTYTTPSTSSMQIGINGEALDGPEVAAARIDERMELANGVERSAVGSRLLRERQSHIHDNARILTSSAPLGTDGRVVDTPEVVAAKVAHAAAHVHERINLANEIARSGGGAVDSSSANSDADKILDTSKIAAVRSNGKVDLTNEAARSGNTLPRTVNDRVVPLALGNGIVAALIPISPDGRLLDVPEVAVRGNQNLVNDMRSVDALAVAGRSLAYGRLIY